MANELNLDLNLDTKPSGGQKDNKGGKKKPEKVRKRSLSKALKGIWSELKKVEWPPFKRTAKHSGVFAKLGTVLVVTFFFLIFITAFDSGLLALLRLLTRR
jgi:preprotein translocase SecE subunit